MNDLELGKKVLKSFYDNARFYFPKQYNFSFEIFLKTYQPDEKKLNIILDGIGGGVRETELSDSKIKDAMAKMALASGGKVPSSYNAFFQYLQGEASKISWVDAAGFVAKESAIDILKGAQSVGDSLIFTGKILNFLLPAIALVFVFYFINKKTEGGASKFLNGFKK
jgi:hypothetical protein